MDALVCSLHALLACFSWSNIYVDGGLSYHDSTEIPYLVWRTRVNRLPGVIETVREQVATDDPFNPYGRLAIGYELRFSYLTLALEASHRSSIELDDRGINAIGISARWYPFHH